MCHSPHRTQGAAAELGKAQTPTSHFVHQPQDHQMSPSYSIYSLNHCWLLLLFLFPENHPLCQGAAVAAPDAFGEGGQREAPLQGHDTQMGLPCAWWNVLPIAPHPLWTGSWGEGTDLFLKPQHVTGFKQPFCSSVHAAHVTPQHVKETDSILKGNIICCFENHSGYQKTHSFKSKSV